MSNKVYVYPKGQTGEMLGNMIEYCDGIKVDYIDDGVSGIRLEDLKDEILVNSGVMHLAWDKRSGLNDATIEKLITKLDGLELSYLSDSIEYYSNKTLQILQKTFIDRVRYKVVGIELGGLANDKHVGYLDDELVKEFQDGDLQIVYFCALNRSYEKMQKKIRELGLNAIAVCFPTYYLDWIDCVDVLTRVTWTGKNKNVISVMIGHGLVDYSAYDAEGWSQFADYLCSPSKKLMPKNSIQNMPYIDTGYLGFDTVAKKLANYTTNIHQQREIILFIAFDQKELSQMIPFMQEATKRYFVILWIGTLGDGNNWTKIDKILGDLKQSENFSIDYDWELSLDSYMNSLLLICGVSSTKITYPLITLKPSFSFSKARWVAELGEVCDWEISPKDFIREVDKIISKKDEWKQRILKYRNENIYNFGHASEYLAKYIKNLLQKDEK